MGVVDEPLGRYPWRRRWRSRQYAGGRMEQRWHAGDSHEETGLSAGTVTNDDELATDFRHLRDGSRSAPGGWQWTVRSRAERGGGDDGEWCCWGRWTGRA